MRPLLPSVFLLFALCLTAQREDYVWVLGGYESIDTIDAATVVDFNVSPPSFGAEFQFPGMFLTNTSISDPEGYLVLYSNGRQVFDQFHNTIGNGDGFQPALFDDALGYVSIQGGLLFPSPEHNQQYIFVLCDYVDYQLGDWFRTGCSPLTYSVIDMNAGNNGAVIEKKSVLSSDTLLFGQLTGVPHANGQDWWLIGAPGFGEGRFRKFLLSPSGISLHHEQDMSVDIHSGTGQAAISPDGKWLAYYNWYEDYENGDLPSYTEVTLFSFDRCTGELGGPVQFSYKNEGAEAEKHLAMGGLAFSGNSRFLYYSAIDKIQQFDLEANDVLASETTVAIYDGFIDEQGEPAYFSLMKLAPDGRVYVASTTFSTRYMHVIAQPDLLGTASDVQQHSLLLPTFNLHSLPHHPVFRLDSVSCDSLVDVVERPLDKRGHFHVYPNPADSQAYLEYELSAGQNGTWALYGAFGQKVLEEALPTGRQRRAVVLDELARGVYFYRATANGENIAEGKLVIF